MSVRRMLVKVCQKMIKDNNSKREFPVWFGYRQQENPTTHQLEDVVTPTVDEEGKPAMKAVPFKVKLTEAFQKRYPALKFPCIMTIDLDARLGDMKFAFITKDKNKDKNVRLDKYGNEHLLLVVNDVVDTIVEIELEDYDFDDIDNFETKNKK